MVEDRYVLKEDRNDQMKRNEREKNRSQTAFLWRAWQSRQLAGERHDALSDTQRYKIVLSRDRKKRERLLLAMCICSHFPLNVHLSVAIGNDSLCVALKPFFDSAEQCSVWLVL